MRFGVAKSSRAERSKVVQSLVLLSRAELSEAQLSKVLRCEVKYSFLHQRFIRGSIPRDAQF